MRRTVVLVALGALVVPGGVLAVQRLDRPAHYDRVSQTGQGPVPTLSPAAPLPSTTALPSPLLPTTPPSVLPSSLGCPRAADLPAAQSTRALAQESHLGSSVALRGDQLWFGEIESYQDGRVRLDVADIKTGAVSRLPFVDDVVSFQLLGTDAWVQAQLDLVRYDTTARKELGRWTPADLAPRGVTAASVVSTEATPSTVYVLGTGLRHRTWLSALDVASGSLRWTWDVPAGWPGQWTLGRGNGLTATRDGAYVALPDRWRRLAVWHVDPSGRLVATAHPRARTMPYDLPRLVAGAHGIYLSQVLPRAAAGESRGALLRLDPRTVTTLAQLDGWQRGEVVDVASGVWSRGTGCSEGVLSHHDPLTLTVDREYLEGDGSVISFALDGPNPVVLRQRTDAAQSFPLDLEVLPPL